MPRNNRSTVIRKMRRTQRSKILRSLGGEQVYRYVMDARPESGSLTVRIAAVVCVIAGLLGATVAQADARAVRIDAPETEQTRNPVIWVEHVQTRWYYVELYDGSEWMVTRCRYEDSHNCYWNAKKRGNHRGHSFVDLRGNVHRVDYRFQP